MPVERIIISSRHVRKRPDFSGLFLIFILVKSCCHTAVFVAAAH